MAIELKGQPERMQVFAVVRDKDTGEPRFDDIHGIHPALWAMLTPEEQQRIEDDGGYPANRER